MYNYEYIFFQSAFWSLFNNFQRSQSNQKQCSLCCSSPCFHVLLCTHYGSLQCFSTYFCKLKEIGVLGPIFLDYIISCDYSLINGNRQICSIGKRVFTWIGHVVDTYQPTPPHYTESNLTLHLCLAVIILAKDEQINEVRTLFRTQNTSQKPTNIYLFKIKNRNSRKRCETCSKLTMKILKRRPAFKKIEVIWPA